MRIAAFDLSLTRPAACIDGDLDVLETKPFRGHARLEAISMWVSTHSTGADLVAIEGYAYGRPNQAHQIGELGGIVRHSLWLEDRPYMDISPSSVKTYATGRGNASKDDVLTAAIRRGGERFTGSSNDEADAFWIWALAMDLAGDPVLDLPQDHRRALNNLTLPERTAA